MLSDKTQFFNFQRKKDPLKDLSTLIMEERFKSEERKEILGEEWRKISRIFDRLDYKYGVFFGTLLDGVYDEGKCSGFC